MRLQNHLSSNEPILTTIKCENLAEGPCSLKNITFVPAAEEDIFEVQCQNIATFNESAFRNAIQAKIQGSKIFFHKSSRSLSAAGDITSTGTIRFHMEDTALNKKIAVKKIFNDLSSIDFQDNIRAFGLVLEQSQVPRACLS